MENYLFSRKSFFVLYLIMSYSHFAKSLYKSLVDCVQADSMAKNLRKQTHL